MSRPVDVLVVGAGPTGLALALQAHDHGARVRIVERRPCAFRPSRALIMHPRTLEELRPLGVTEALLAKADVAPEAKLHLGAHMLRLHLGDLALRDTAYPHLTLVRQTHVETVLARALADRGIEVERGLELVTAKDDGAGVRAKLRSQTGVDVTDCDFLAGCDGQASTVRRLANIDWRGARYAQEVVLADVELSGPLAAHGAHIVVGRAGVVLAFALGERATWRLLMTRPAGSDRLPFGPPGPSVMPAELQTMLDEAGLGARITATAWSARFPLQHRLAARFRSGNLFLAGDAAHAHSPATGQGMNTGIQDALNLGWKLAFAAHARDPGDLLDSYELERRPVARRVLALTHVAFWAEANGGPIPAVVRGFVAPRLAPALAFLSASRGLVSEAVRLVSQLGVAYRDSPLSDEGVPRLRCGPRSGDRLGDATVAVSGRCIRLHTLLATPGVHVLLHRDAPRLDLEALGPHVRVHRLTSAPGGGVVAVRPDGYIGYRCGTVDVAQLRTWLHRLGATQSASDNGTDYRELPAVVPA